MKNCQLVNTKDNKYFGHNKEHLIGNNLRRKVEGNRGKEKSESKTSVTGWKITS